MKKTKALELIADIQIELDALTKKLQHDKKTKKIDWNACWDSASRALDCTDAMAEYFWQEYLSQDGY